jgi:hypothetical protein
MMKTFEDRHQAGLVKKFHTLLGRYGIDNATKLSILQQYNVTSSVYLSIPELIEVCGLIEKANNPALKELDLWRRRLMAAIGGWLRSMNRIDSANIIKGIACRAAKKDSFNDIPLEQLRSLYSAFTKKQKDLQTVDSFTTGELNKQILMN